MNDTKSLFSKGYGAVREQTNRCAVYLKSCESCDFFSQEDGDTEELCQNPNVTRYDMSVTETNICCSLWKACEGSSKIAEEKNVSKAGKVCCKRARR